MADQDQLSLEDMQALRHVHEQLSRAKDPRAQKVGAYLMSQIQSDPQYASPESAPGPGFMDVIGDFAKHGPDRFMQFITGHPTDVIDKNFATRARASGDAFRKGDISTGVGQGLAAFLPGSGDEAVAAGEEFGAGNIGGGLGHSALALLPMARVPKISPKVGPAIKGGFKGGVESVVDAKTSLPALAGAGIGSFIGGKTGAEIGAGLGAAPGVIKGVVRGAREGIAAMTPEPVAPIPFKVSPVTARRMQYPGPASAPSSQATPPIPRKGLDVEGSLVPPSKPPVTMPGGPSPYDLSGKLRKATPNSGEAGMPRSTGGRAIRPVSRLFSPEIEGAPVPEPTAKPQTIQPIAAPSTRYQEMVQTGGDVLAQHGTKIDNQIATHLKSKGYTPEDVMGMSEDQLYTLSKGGVPTLKRFGTSGKASRPFAIRQKDIFDALSKEWGR